MKRTFGALITLLVLLLSFSSIAQAANSTANNSFSIRNGIRFGMSIDEVRAIEQKNGNGSGELDYSTYTLVYKNLSVAGVPTSSIYYYFDLETNKLKDILYKLGGETVSSSTASDIYQELYPSLKKKYGNPQSSFSSNFQTKAGNIWLTSAFASGGIYKNKFHNVWFDYYDDCDISIELIGYSTKSNSSNYFCQVGYRQFDKGAIENEVNKDLKKEQEKQEQKSSDL